MRLSRKPLYTATQIRARVGELAADVSRDFAGRDVVAIIVLKGGLHFGSDLIRALTIPVAIDFVRAKSYDGTKSGGRIEFLTLPSLPLAGKHVLILEDILDTGLTAHGILEHVRSEHPASVSFCALFDKPVNRRVELKGTYTGFELRTQFVVGYGLDYEERYRELPDVYTLETGE